MDQPPAAPPFPDLTAVVLCGGRGSRMGGLDKGLVPYRGRALAERVLERLRPQAGALLLSANRSLAEYRRFGPPVLGDLRPDFAGPLAGVEAALAHCATEWLLVVPCDTPHLPHDLAARLRRGAAGGAAFAADPQRDHPVIHLFRRAEHERLRRYLDGGGASVKGWLAELGAARVVFEAAEDFRNCNREDDLR